MKKGKILVVLSLLLVAAMMAAIGTGAIDVFTADRSAAVTIENDADGFVAITGDNTWAYEDAAGRLGINFSDSNPNAVGKGFNRTSTTEVKDVFRITNQSANDIYVWLEGGKGWLAEPSHPASSGWAAKSYISYQINRDATTGSVTQSTHWGHSKFDLMSTYVKDFVNGEVTIDGNGQYTSAYVKLTPGQTVAVDVKCNTAGVWPDNQSYWDGLINHTIRVKANASAPVVK